MSAIASQGAAAYGYAQGYKDRLAAAGMQFHTEVFFLAVDAIAAAAGAALAAGATRIVSLRISQEADFVVEKIMEFSADDADAVTPQAAGYRVQIFDNATNRALSNLPVPKSCAAGTAQRPMLIKPRLFRRNSDVSLIFTADTFNAAALDRLFFVMMGYKIFDPNALNLNSPQ